MAINSDVNAKVEERLRAQRWRDAVRFVPAWIAVLAVWQVGVLVFEHVTRWAMNDVPKALGIACIVTWIVCFTLQFAARRWPSLSEVFLVVASVLQCLVNALGNPEVQAFVWNAAPEVFGAFGNAPGCGSRVDGVCINPLGSLRNTNLMLASLVFLLVFVFSARAAMVSSFLCVVLYICLTLPPKLVPGYPVIDPCFEYVYAIMLPSFALVGNYKMESCQRKWLFEMVQKEQQVLAEMVKRCEAEFQCEVMRADHAGGSGHVAAGSVSSGESAKSSPSIFNALHAGVGLRRLIALGRKEHWLIDEEDQSLMQEGNE